MRDDLPAFLQRKDKERGRLREQHHCIPALLRNVVDYSGFACCLRAGDDKEFAHVSFQFELSNCYQYLGNVPIVNREHPGVAPLN